MWRTLAVAGFICFTAATTARAQDDGDAPRGRTFAQQVCSGCHALQKGEINSPHPDAPTTATKRFVESRSSSSSTCVSRPKNLCESATSNGRSPGNGSPKGYGIVPAVAMVTEAG